MKIIRDKIKVYISAPFFDKEQNAKVSQVEKALKENPTVNVIFSPRKNKITKYPVGTPKWCQAIYNLDIKNLVNSNATVEILDFDGHDCDSGTAFEMAYAKAHHILTTTIKFDDSPVNLMLGKASDYHFKDLKDLAHYDFAKPKYNHYNIKMH